MASSVLRSKVNGRTLLLVYLTMANFKLVPISGVDFDRNRTGVVFSPRVLSSQLAVYSPEQVKTMLRVIATKFSRISTVSVAARTDTYEWNSTYYDSGSEIYTAEAAAMINKERNETTLTVHLGIFHHGQMNRSESEVLLALESVKKSNEIYPGTVKRFVFGVRETDLKTGIRQANETLSLIRTYKAQAAAIGITFGSKLNCREALTTSSTSASSPLNNLAKLRQQIIKETNFVTCGIKLTRAIFRTGSEQVLEREFASLRDDVKKVNPNAEVIIQTCWPSSGASSWQTIANLRRHWEISNKLAVKLNITVWFHEAFDEPWRSLDQETAHYGWWRLKENSPLDDVESYVEKIYEEDEDVTNVDTGNTGNSTWIYVGIVVGALVLLQVLVIGFIYQFRKRNKSGKFLTKEEIRAFLHGLSETDLDATSNDNKDSVGGVGELALKFPYDKGFEIPKDKLKINKKFVLGVGQYGCVVKATIDNSTFASTEVALKMPNDDCPKQALKGILSEIKILIYLGKHENIVSIIGAYTAEIRSGLVYLATEYCHLGSLKGYLTRRRKRSLHSELYSTHDLGEYNEDVTCDQVGTSENVSFLEMVHWSHQIASGMEYLASKQVIHADLATRNVLLTCDKTAKITDFGLSRRLYEYTKYVKKQIEPLPWRWMAIESLRRLEFSEYSDVWSYGVTLWEIFSMGDVPYPGFSWSLDFLDDLESGLRMKYPDHANPDIYNIMMDCWHTVPNKRPVFSQLTTALDQILRNIPDYAVREETPYLDLFELL